jgi:murein DD-endopeptidase MepM/ murein hydrolase activator NlpD/phage-related protein
MPSVGTAYVNIRVNTKGFEDALDKALGRMTTKMDVAGRQLGKSMTSELKKTDWDDGFKGLTESANKASTKAAKSLDRINEKVLDLAINGQDAGNSMARGMDHATRSTNEMNASLNVTNREARKAQRSVGSIGGGGGGGLRKAGNDAGFFASRLRELGSEASSNTAMLHGLYNMLSFGGTAAAGLVGALSGAAQGIFVVGANAAAAAPALGVFASGMLSLIQVGAAVAISMKGVGEALKAGFDVADKSAAATGGASKALSASTKAAADAARRAVDSARRGVRDAVQGVQDAARAVADARQGLVDAYRDAARAASDAARRTADAERALAQAQRETTAAQEALNAARAEGLEQMEDIAFAAEDAGMAERRASISLQDAIQKLQAVSELPPDNRMRVEAQLAYDEAELNMRQAVDRREDADKAQQESAKRGVEGSEAVRGAHEALADARANEADASRDVSDARREEADTAEDNARRIRDAQDGIADAQRGLADAQQALADAQAALADAQKRQNDAADKATPAMTALATATDAYKAAMDKLSPSQKKFVERILGMREGFDKFKRAVAEPLFSRLLTAMDQVNTKGKDGKSIQDVLTKGLQGTSRALGDTAIKAANLAKNDVFQKQLGDAMDYNNDAIGHFGGALVNLGKFFVAVADAAGPLFDDFAKWIESVTGDWADKASGDIDGLRKSIETGGDRVREFWGLAKQLWRTLRVLGGAANDAANEFKWYDDFGRARRGYIPALTDSLSDFNDKLDTTEGRESLFDRFTQALDNLSASGRAIKTITQPFIDMGSDPQIETALNTISESDAFARLGDTAGDAVPELTDLVVAVADLVADMSESGSIDHFLDILTKVATEAGKVTGYLNDKGILKFIGYATGAAAAVRLLWKAFKITTSPFVMAGKGAIGLGTNIRDNTGKIKDSWKEARKGEGVFKSLGTKAKDMLKNTWTRFTDLFRRAENKKLPKTKADTKSAGEEAKSKAAGTSITKAFAEGIREGLALVEAAMEALEAKVGSGLTEISTSMTARSRTTGLNIMRGLAQGIEAGVPIATTAVGQATGKIIAAINRGAGTASPSVKTMKTGADVMEGLEIGIQEGTVEAVATARTAGTEVGAAIGSTLGPATAAGTAEMKASMAGAAATVSTELAVVDASLVGTQVAMETTGVVGRVASLGVRAFGGAMALVGGPLGLIMLALPFLIPLLKKLNDKFHLTEKIMDAVKWALDKVGDAFKWLWDKMKDLWDWVKSNWGLLLAIITGPFGLAVRAIIKNWDKIIKFVKGVPGKIKRFLRGLWNSVSEGLRKVWDRVQQIWGRIVTWVKGRPGQFVRNLKALWNVLGDRLRVAWTTIKGIWATIVKWIEGRPKAIAGKLKSIWGGLREGFKSAWTFIKGLWDDKIWPFFRDLPKNIGDKLKNIFRGIAQGFRSAVDWVLGKVQTYLINPFNSILGKFGVKSIKIELPNIPTVNYASGGLVRGPGGPRDDKIPAMLSNREYVLPARRVRDIGVQNLDYMRTHGTLPPAGDIGGLGGWFKSGWQKIKSVASVLKNGAEAAVKWVLSRATSALSGGGIIQQLARGWINWAGNKITSWGHTKDAAAKKKQEEAAGSDYTGPSGGWTYTIPKSIHTYNWPGHSPATALDMGAGMGTPVRALSGGTASVRFAAGRSYGNYIIVTHRDGWKSLYAHLSRTVVKSGATVRPGTLIAYSGNTGQVPAHLHLELSKNPGSSGSTSTNAELVRRGIKYPYKYGGSWAKGGVIGPQTDGSGVLALLAEAGKAERITPLDSEGFTPAERRMLEALENRVGGGGGDTFHVHPSSQMNEAALADMIARRVAWKRRQGSGVR